MVEDKDLISEEIVKYFKDLNSFDHPDRPMANELIFWQLNVKFSSKLEE